MLGTGSIHSRPGKPRRHICESAATVLRAAEKTSGRRCDSARRRAAQGETRRTRRSSSIGLKGDRPGQSAPGQLSDAPRVREVSARPRAGSPGRAAPPRRGGRLPSSFTMANGAQCRNWDDFLILSAQSWAHVRDELVSGRLAEYLRRIGRPELIPHVRARSFAGRAARRVAGAHSGDPVERSGARRTSRNAAGSGEDGGRRREAFAADHERRLPAVAEQLCGSSPADARWVRLLAGGDGKAFPTIDQTEIPVELELPETIDRVIRAADRHREQRRHAAGRGSGRAAA